MKNTRKYINFTASLFLLASLLILPACSAKKAGRALTRPQIVSEIDDIKNFPQELSVYARSAGGSRRLLDQEVQAILDARFNQILFGPWHMKKTSIRKGEVSSLFRKARGYKDASMVWTQPEWDAMLANADLGAYPSMAQAAITLRNTDLRELPTHERRFSEPTADIKANPFDYFQYSLLPIGTPLLVAHATLDGKWYYVECPIAGGWVDAGDVAFVDEEFRQLWQSGQFAALARDKVVLPGTGRGGRDSQSGIGAILPLGEGPAGGLNILVPMSGSGAYARSAEISLPPGAAVKKPFPLTPDNVARIGNVMIKQPYGWGGTLGERDCSAMTRDLFAPFGIWLPRNSAAQAKRGAVVSLSGLSAPEKENVILNEGEPFLSLVGMRGHIMLYVGKWKGRPAIFHNVWGVRIVEDGDDDARFVIGKAVVTSITPGMELKNLYRPITFVDRLRSLITPGRP